MLVLKSFALEEHSELLEYTLITVKMIIKFSFHYRALISIGWLDKIFYV